MRIPSILNLILHPDVIFEQYRSQYLCVSSPEVIFDKNLHIPLFKRNIRSCVLDVCGILSVVRF